MDLFEAIHTRRSIRKYTDEPVSDEAVREVIAAAMAAPSAGNAQPWQFVVITEREKLDKIPEFHKYAAMCRQAPVAVAACGDLSREKYKGFWVQDVSAAVQNMLLAARAKGLGAVWTGLYPEMDRVEGMRKLLGLPEHVMPLALVPMGHPAQESKRKDRYDPERVRYNHW